MRKRVTILKPKVRWLRPLDSPALGVWRRLTGSLDPPLWLQIEAKLLQALPAWEKEHQRAFCINGERIIETIQAALDAKQAEKDLRHVRLTRQTLSPTSSSAP